MKKAVIALITTITCATVYAQNIDLVSLGSATFNVQEQTGSGTQDATGLIWAPSVSGGDLMAGTFAGADWTPYTNPLNYTGFGIRMSFTGINPDLVFAVTLFDDSFNVVDVWDVSTVGITDTPGIAQFLAVTIPGTGNYSSIVGMQIDWGGSATINTKATEIVAVAVPEPATYALLAMGAVAMGGYMMRRRQRG